MSGARPNPSASSRKPRCAKRVCQGAPVLTGPLPQIDWGTANVGMIVGRMPCRQPARPDALQVPFFSVISGAHHAAVAVWVGWEGVDAYLKMAKRGNWLRAVDYALSSSLMLVVTSILFRSPPDVPTLMLVAAVQSAIILIGYLLERLQYRQTTTEERQPLLSGQGDDISTVDTAAIQGDLTADTTSGKQAFGVWIPFAASMLIYALVWTSLLIPFHYAVEDAPTAVVIFIASLAAPGARRGLTVAAAGLPGGDVHALPDRVCVWGAGTGSRDGLSDSEHACQGGQSCGGTAATLHADRGAQVPLLMLFYFGIVARSGTVVFERLEGAFNTTGSSSSASDTELYIAFGASIAVVTIVAILMWGTRPNRK